MFRSPYITTRSSRTTVKENEQVLILHFTPDTYKPHNTFYTLIKDRPFVPIKQQKLPSNLNVCNVLCQALLHQV